MKACFFMQRQFAYLAHGVAVNLKDRYNLTDFCGYVGLRPGFEFLKEQKDITYTTLLLDEDVHESYKQEKLDLEYLQNLEKEYGIPNLWPFIAVDRVLMFNQLIREYPYNTPNYTHEEMLRILQVTAKQIITFFEKERPDFLFMSVIGSVGSYLLYQIAKKKGIKVFIVQLSSIKHRYCITEDYKYFTGAAELLKDPQKITAASRMAAQNFVTSFRSEPHPYYEYSDPRKQPTKREQQFTFLAPSKLLGITKFLKGYFQEYFTQPIRNDYSYIGPWNYLKDSTLRKLRNLRGVHDLYGKFDPNEKYAFFPLHYEPEIALLLHAPFVADQINVIKQVARSLPVGYKLYVKDHPQMVVYRPRSYYIELKKIPNVVLLNPSMPSFPITKAAKLITTITGTVGWEASIFGLPVITFGDTFYNKLSFVDNCRTMEELPYLIQKKLEHFTYNEAELIEFIAAILQDSAELDLHGLWEREQNFEKRKTAIRPLADLLARKLGLAEKATV